MSWDTASLRDGSSPAAATKFTGQSREWVQSHLSSKSSGDLSAAKPKCTKGQDWDVTVTGRGDEGRRG